jgi:hypothetical protein
VICVQVFAGTLTVVCRAMSLLHAVRPGRPGEGVRV